MDAREQAIEVMARAQFNGVWAGGQGGIVDESWATAPDAVREPYCRAATRMLDALLAATQEQTCPTCGGSGASSWVQGGVTYTSGDIPCPDCTDGVVPGTEPLLAQLLIEQGWTPPEATE